MAGLMFDSTTGGYSASPMGEASSTFGSNTIPFPVLNPSVAGMQPSVVQEFGVSNTPAFVTDFTNIPETASTGATSMQNMMALKQAVDNFKPVNDPSLGAGTRIGSGIGAAIGTGVGFYAGGPAGAAVGGAIGSTVGAIPGSILDFWAAKDEIDAQKEEQSLKKQEANALRNYSWSRQRLADRTEDEQRADAKFASTYNKMNAVVQMLKKRNDEKLAKKGLLATPVARPMETGAAYKAGLQGGMF